MPRLSERTAAHIVLIALAAAGLALVYWMYDGQTANAQPGGTYEMVMTFPSSGSDGPENFGETFAPCYSQGNCNFSCGPATVGRGCSNLVCSGTGAGGAAYFYTHEYACVYTPPPYTPPTCTPDTSCAASTCSTDTCQATAANCSTYAIQGTKNCTPQITCQDLDISLWGTYPNCYFPTCQQLGNCPVGPTCQEIDISYWGDYPPNCYFPTCQQLGNCPVQPPGPTCQELDISLWGDYPPNCYFPTCQQLGFQAGTPPNGCYNNPNTCANGSPGPYPACPLGPNPTPSVSCSPSSQNLPAGGGTANFTSSVSDGAGSPYAWLDGSNNVIGTGSSLARSFTSDGSVRVRASDGSGGYVYSGYCVVDVAAAGGGACPGPDSATLTATPNRVRADMNTPIEIAWTGSNLDSTSCTLSNMNTGAEVGNSTVTLCGTSGSATISGGVSAQTAYRLECGLLTKDVIVNIVPAFEEF